MAKAMEFENPMFEDDYADGETTGAGEVAADVADDVVDDVVTEIAAGVAGDIIAAKKVDPLRVNPTGIGDGSVVGNEGLSQAQRVLASAVNDYYKNLASDQGLSPELPDINQFVLVDNRLRLKNYPDINLTNARTGRPNTLGYIAGHWKGGGEAIRQDLGFPNWSPKLSAAAAAALRRANQELGKAAEDTDNVGLQDVGQVMTEAANAFQTMETSFTELGQSGVPPIARREFRGVYRALERFRGEYTNNVAKLSELDRNIGKKEDHLALERR